MTADSTRSPAQTDRGARRAGLAVALLAVFAAACTALGFWQLGRAGESRATAERFAAAGERMPARLRTADGAPPELRWRRAEAVGRYVADRQILLDNIVRDGAAGYYVLTPFEPADGGPWLLVNRGWVRADPDRRVLPEVSVAGGERRVTGVLDALPVPGLSLGREPLGPSAAPLTVVHYPTIDELERALGRRLFGYQLLLDRDEPDGFARDFPAPGLDPARHIGYAVQWWAFASIAAGAALTIGWRTLRGRNG